MEEEKETWDYGYIHIPFEELHSLLQLPSDWKVVAMRRRRELDKSFLEIGVQHPSLPDPLRGRNSEEVPDWELRDMKEPEVSLVYATENRDCKEWRALQEIKVNPDGRERVNEQLWKRRHDIDQLLRKALFAKEAKHKQWYLHRLADELNIPGYGLMSDQGENPEDGAK